MKVNVIKAGYRINVGSWKNDYDNYHTKTKEGCSAQEVKFIIAICKLFNYDKFRNSDVPVRELHDAIVNVISEHEFARGSIEAQVEQVSDIVYDLIGTAKDGSYRAFERVTVDYIPEEIAIQDVTEEFEND